MPPRYTQTKTSLLSLSMKLREALQISHRPQPDGEPFSLDLVTGFEPLHLRVFLSAHVRMRLRTDRQVLVRTGLFGDFSGNLERTIQAAGAGPVIVTLEWADLHPLLGWREPAFVAAGFDEPVFLQEIETRLGQWSRILAGADQIRIVLALPVLPLPPWVGRNLKGQRSRLVLELDSLLSQFARDAARHGVRVIANPVMPAWDPAKHLMTGFPYNPVFTDALANRIAEVAMPAAPKKGLITDLDHTLWRGIVGDDGSDGVHWDLDHQARVHGWWQQFLAALAGQGTLIGVASKNDLEPVAAALARKDLLAPVEKLFPIEAHWLEKTESIHRIAAAWNVGLNSVVFVDDNPLEIDAVRQAMPEVECFFFPANDPAGVAELLERLRELYGVESVRDEDLLRVASLRQRVEIEEHLVGSGSGAEDRFANLGSRLKLDLRRPAAPRALELINKTNQFNLNGSCWDEADWQSWSARPEARVALLGYEDRYGPLGNIAVLAAEQQGENLMIRSWVMSCRAFSRRIEFATLQCLLECWQCQTIQFDWRKTERNEPTAMALRTLVGELPASGILEISVAALRKSLPLLYLDNCEVLEN